jgi:hypothetical protein
MHWNKINSNRRNFFLIKQLYLVQLGKTLRRIVPVLMCSEVCLRGTPPLGIVLHHRDWFDSKHDYLHEMRYHARIEICLCVKVV